MKPALIIVLLTLPLGGCITDDPALAPETPEVSAALPGQTRHGQWAVMNASHEVAQRWTAYRWAVPADHPGTTGLIGLDIKGNATALGWGLLFFAEYEDRWDYFGGVVSTPHHAWEIAGQQQDDNHAPAQGAASANLGAKQTLFASPRGYVNAQGDMPQELQPNQSMIVVVATTGAGDVDVALRTLDADGEAPDQRAARIGLDDVASGVGFEAGAWGRSAITPLVWEINAGNITRYTLLNEENTLQSAAPSEAFQVVPGMQSGWGAISSTIVRFGGAGSAGSFGHMFDQHGRGDRAPMDLNVAGNACGLVGQCVLDPAWIAYLEAVGSGPSLWQLSNTAANAYAEQVQITYWVLGPDDDGTLGRGTDRFLLF